MRKVDLTSGGRIPAVVQLLQEVSRALDPFEIQRHFTERLGEYRPFDGYISLSTRGLETGQFRVTRRLIPSASIHEFDNPWERTEPYPVQSGGFLSEIISREEPQLFEDLHLTGDPVLGDALKDVHSLYAVPLFDSGHALNWSLALMHRPELSMSDHIAEDFLMRANLIGGLTRSLLHAAEVKRLNGQLEDQLEEIAQVQRSLLPNRTPHIPGLEIATSYLTSNAAGGDFYDFIPLESDRWGFVIADVSGHGAGAATVVAMLQTALRGQMSGDMQPHETLMRINRQLHPNLIDGHFITAFMGVLDPASKQLVYANAGHHPPKRRRQNGDLIGLDEVASLPLGVLDDVSYESASVRLDNGDTLVLFTDGITEAFSPPPERAMFGDEGLAGALEHCTGAPPCVIESIHERLYAHTRSRERDDDQTLVVVQTEL